MLHTQGAPVNHIAVLRPIGPPSPMAGVRGSGNAPFGTGPQTAVDRTRHRNYFHVRAEPVHAQPRLQAWLQCVGNIN